MDVGVKPGLINLLIPRDSDQQPTFINTQVCEYNSREVFDKNESSLTKVLRKVHQLHESQKGISSQF
jgi:hypothetical protein